MSAPSSRWGAALALAVALLAPGTAAAIRVAYAASSHDPATVNRVRDARLLESIAQWLDRFTPSDKLVLRMADCAEANAMYYSARAEMVLCTELVGRVVGLHDQYLDAQTRARLNGATLLWLAAHEYGHALIHGRRWPVLGREEDAADQIATLIALRSGMSAHAITGALNFFHRELSQGDASDVHSLDPVRRANIACWAYGSSPTMFAALGAQIPALRRQGCSREAALMRRGVEQALRLR